MDIALQISRARAQASWTVQICCIRHSITATASAPTPSTTVLQRVRSTERPEDRERRDDERRRPGRPRTRAGCRSACCRRTAAMIARISCAISSTSTSTSEPRVRSAGFLPTRPSTTQSRPAETRDHQLHDREPQDHASTSAVGKLTSTRAVPFVHRDEAGEPSLRRERGERSRASGTASSSFLPCARSRSCSASRVDVGNSSAAIEAGLRRAPARAPPGRPRHPRSGTGRRAVRRRAVRWPPTASARPEVAGEGPDVGARRALDRARRDRRTSAPRRSASTSNAEIVTVRAASSTGLAGAGQVVGAPPVDLDRAVGARHLGDRLRSGPRSRDRSRRAESRSHPLRRPPRPPRRRSSSTLRDGWCAVYSLPSPTR